MNEQPFVLQGVYTALATPFLDGRIDWESLGRLVEFQIEAGVDGVVPVGTTGESPTLSYDEHIEVIARVVSFVKGRVPVIAGTGANSTEEAVLLTQRAEAAGADAFLQVAPYYNKPSQEGIYRHFAKVAECTRKPIILYSIPGRCGVEILPATTARLHQSFPHILAMKEAAGNCDRVTETLELTDETFTVLSGDDSLTLPFMSLGAKGVISVASNLVPLEIVNLVQAALKGDYAIATPQNRRLFRLCKHLFLEANPVPVKYALFRAEIIDSPEVRLPLCEMKESNREILEETLRHYQLI